MELVRKPCTGNFQAYLLKRDVIPTVPNISLLMQNMEQKLFLRNMVPVVVLVIRQIKSWKGDDVTNDKKQFWLDDGCKGRLQTGSNY